MAVHENSKAAYAADQRKLGARERMIFDHIAASSEPLSDRVVKEQLFGVAGDMNMVRPRITTLIERGWLCEVGVTRDHVTDKPVRLTRARTPGERALHLAGQCRPTQCELL